MAARIGGGFRCSAGAKYFSPVRPSPWPRRNRRRFPLFRRGEIFFARTPVAMAPPESAAVSVVPQGRNIFRPYARLHGPRRNRRRFPLFRRGEIFFAPTPVSMAPPESAAVSGFPQGRNIFRPCARRNGPAGIGGGFRFSVGAKYFSPLYARRNRYRKNESGFPANRIPNRIGKTRLVFIPFIPPIPRRRRDLARHARKTQIVPGFS